MMVSAVEELEQSVEPSTEKFKPSEALSKIGNLYHSPPAPGAPGANVNVKSS